MLFGHKPEPGGDVADGERDQIPVAQRHRLQLAEGPALRSAERERMRLQLQHSPHARAFETDRLGALTAGVGHGERAAERAQPCGHKSDFDGALLARRQSCAHTAIVILDREVTRVGAAERESCDRGGLNSTLRVGNRDHLGRAGGTRDSEHLRAEAQTARRDPKGGPRSESRSRLQESDDECQRSCQAEPPKARAKFGSYLHLLFEPESRVIRD
jgi:hypothetical protein